MLRKLGKNITLLNSFAFLMVIIVGGGSIFLAKDILQNVYKSKEMSEHILAVDVIHADSFQFLLAIHHFLIDPDEIYAAKAVRLLAKMEKEISHYKEHEEKEVYKDGKSREIDLLNKISEDIQGQKEIFEYFEEYSKTGTLTGMHFRVLRNSDMPLKIISA